MLAGDAPSLDRNEHRQDADDADRATSHRTAESNAGHSHGPPPEVLISASRARIPASSRAGCPHNYELAPQRLARSEFVMDCQYSPRRPCLDFNAPRVLGEQTSYVLEHGIEH